MKINNVNINIHALAGEVAEAANVDEWRGAHFSLL